MGHPILHRRIDRKLAGVLKGAAEHISQLKAAQGKIVGADLDAVYRDGVGLARGISLKAVAARKSLILGGVHIDRIWIGRRILRLDIRVGAAARKQRHGKDRRKG